MTLTFISLFVCDVNIKNDSPETKEAHLYSKRRLHPITRPSPQQANQLAFLLSQAHNELSANHSQPGGNSGS